MGILENINGHSDLIKLNTNQQIQLCEEIREFLVNKVSKTGGHLASNLGAVELTVAIETVFDTQRDRLVFDVGHQSYVHKMLTGRQKEFDHLRQFGGMAGFPKPDESVTDAFTAGHASSSVSIALGMARARSAENEDYSVVAVIGDGAATGGLAYEGLNDAGASNEPLIVILNDNAMSISKNVGGLSRHLSQLRMKERYLGMKSQVRSNLMKIPGGETLAGAIHDIKQWLKRMFIPTTIFEEMGLNYLGPVDGHDLPALIQALKSAKSIGRPVVLHVLTKKGMGYAPAETEPAIFHGIGKFDPQTGQTATSDLITFSGQFGKTLLDVMEKDLRVCGITAAMLSGTGLQPVKEKFPKRVWDVGIAEGHAVSMAGGLAKQGMIPVVAIYSTFLQRSYDMIFQDVAMQHLHVVFAVDRAGLVGEDGETHHGIYDLGFLRQIPGMLVLCPATCHEFGEMLAWAIEEYDGPVAVRYPRGGDRGKMIPESVTDITCCREGKSAVILTYGSVVHNCIGASDVLANRGMDIRVMRLSSVEPLQTTKLIDAIGETKSVFVVEEAAEGSGISQDVAWILKSVNPEISVQKIDLGKRFIPHGNLESLYHMCGLDAESIADKIEEALKSSWKK